MTDQSFALVEHSYHDPDRNLVWNPVGLFPDFEQAFAWCNANKNTSVILLEKPHIVGCTKPDKEPILANFIDQIHRLHLTSWNAEGSWVKLKPLDLPPLYCDDVLRIRMCPFGPLKDAKDHFDQ